MLTTEQKSLIKQQILMYKPLSTR